MMVDFAQIELERRLSLYQVFVKLYEHHSSLLDEIFQLENLYQPLLPTVKSRYVHGVVDNTAVYLMTNLCNNQTQSLRQSQYIWTIGRDRNNGIRMVDKYLSRYHAAIQYIEEQGFYLVDFNSSNGSFVNGDCAYQPIKLKDGDRIRLGRMTFDFFLNYQSCALPTVAMELLMQLVPRPMDNDQRDRQKPLTENPDFSLGITKNSGLFEEMKHWHDNFSAEQKSEILDRFFSKQIPYNHS